MVDLSFGLGNVGGLFGGGERRQQMKKGFEYENRYALKREAELWSRAEQRGLTAQEYYGSPAAGGANVNGSAAQTLGNAQTQGQQMMVDSMNREADRENQQEITDKNNEAQIKIAEINAGVSERGQDLNKEIADNILSLDKEKLALQVREVTARIGKTRKETELLTNQIATSDKAFVTAMKQLSMGKENLLVELALRDEGISLSDDNFQKMSKAERERIINRIIALSSTLNQEASGLGKLGAGAVEGAKGTAQSIWQIFQNAVENAGYLAGNAKQSLGSGTGKKGIPLKDIQGYKHFNRDFPGRANN